MKTTWSDAEIDQILARGRLGGPGYDRVFEGAVRARGGRSGARRAAWVALIPSAALASALGLWASVGHAPPQPLRSKGGGANVEPGPVAIEIGCSAARRAACRAGDTLMFKVDARVASGYLVAYAIRADGGASDRIWYFPASDGATPLVRAGEGAVVLDRGIAIGAEHPPGDYRVTVLLTATPPRRSDFEGPAAGAVAVRAQATLDLRVEP
jgi:hypothetical protein